MTALVAHYCPEGAPGQRFYDENKRIAEKVGDMARAYGNGSGVVFYSGDQNINDRFHDTFMGGPLTSLGDELKKWPTTGHGSIDVIASYDGDDKVSGLAYRVLTDNVVPLHSDHYVIEGVFEVKD